MTATDKNAISADRATTDDDELLRAALHEMRGLTPRERVAVAVAVEQSRHQQRHAEHAHRSTAGSAALYKAARDTNTPPRAAAALRRIAPRAVRSNR